MKKIFFYFLMTLFVVNCASDVYAVTFKPQSDEFILGKGANAIDKKLTVDVGDGASNPQLLIDDILKVFDFNKSLDVTGDVTATGDLSGAAGNFSGVLDIEGDTVTIGDGTNTNKKLEFDTGSGANNPYLGWDSVSNSLTFNNGLSEKKIGSGSGSGSGGINLLVNDNFEDTGSPILNWTNSGGTFTQESLTNSREGNENFARLVATTSGQYFESDEVTIADDITGGCMADIYYKQGDEAFELQVLKETSPSTFEQVSGQDFDDVTGDGFLKIGVSTFPCEPGDVFKLRVESTGAGTIDADRSYLGSNKNLGFGEYTQINSCGLSGSDSRSITSDTESIPFDGTCNGWTSGADGASPTNGNYYTVQYSNSSVTISSGVYLNASVDNIYFVAINGTVYKNLSHGAISTSLRQGTLTIPRGEVSKGDKIAILTQDNVTLSGTRDDYHYLNIVEKSTSESVAPFSLEEANFYVDVNIGGANIGISDQTIPSDPSLSLTVNEGQAFITCSDGSQGANTCASGNEQLGIEFNAPRAGKYKICFQAPVVTQSGGRSYSRIVRTENSSDTIIEEGKKVMYSRESDSEISGATDSSCEIFNIENKGKATFKIYPRTNDASVFTYVIDNNSTYKRNASFTVEMVRHNVSAPILTRQDFVYGQEVKLIDKYNGETAYRYCNRVGLETSETDITTGTTVEQISSGLKPIGILNYTSDNWLLLKMQNGGGTNFSSVYYQDSTGDITATASGSYEVSANTVYCMNYTK